VFWGTTGLQLAPTGPPAGHRAGWLSTWRSGHLGDPWSACPAAGSCAMAGPQCSLGRHRV